MLELIDGRDRETPVHIPRPRAPGTHAHDITTEVKAIVDDVRLRGDAAVIEHTERLDGVKLTAAQLVVEEDLLERAPALVRPELIEALEVMAARLERTCERQLPQSWIERGEDEYVGELVRPLRRAGVYAPGGRAAYPSSVIMALTPARVAGVEQVAVASPPSRRGEIAEPVLAACAVAGASEVYRLGGAVAVAALAYGTETIRPVDKVFGPGNLYVTAAKRLVQTWVGTDSEAGPTEIAVIADESADPVVVAADLVAQAEHGPLGCHALITWSEELVEATTAALEVMVFRHERADDVENALIEGGVAVLVRDLEHALDTANALAPEHLELLFEGAFEALEGVRNAGSVFVGPYSPVCAGDYVAGTNHILPTGGSARWSSGLGVTDFVTRSYVCGLERSSLERLAPHIDALSEAEDLPAHARSVERRLAWRR
ncbi:MAG: histidinol dehydrogenase [Actinomycetota bacterium]|nr:histidinol dehydrogenase [Actinomycetota bacterium]